MNCITKFKKTGNSGVIWSFLLFFMKIRTLIELKAERLKLTKQIQNIDRLIEIHKHPRLKKCNSIAKLVKNFTGHDIDHVGKRAKLDVKRAKKIFWRYGFMKGISGTVLSEYTGDKSRYAAFKGRTSHIKSCKNNWEINQEWEKFKEYVKKNNTKVS